MHRLNQVFLVITLALGLLGGVAVADYSQSLGTLEDAGLVESQVETAVVSGQVVDGQFVLEVRIQNPTRFALELNGAYMTVSTGEERIAYGTIVNHGEIPETIPPRGSVAVTYEFALSQQQAEKLRSAMESGSVDVTGRHAVQLAETQFAIEFTGEVSGA